jgi:hypothetical protein
MSEAVRAVLSGIKTVDDMIVAFGNEQRCRRLFEEMIWPKGRICRKRCSAPTFRIVCGSVMFRAEGLDL